MRLNYIDNTDNLAGLRKLPDACIDMTVTSPPYDNLRTYNGFSWDVEGLVAELYRVTKPGGVVVWIVNDATVNGSETGSSFRQALAFMGAGFNLHDTMIWEKDTFSFPDRTRYRACFEYMFVFSKGRPKKVHLITDRLNKWAGTSVHGTSRDVDGSTFRKSNHNKSNVAEVGVRFNVWEIPTEKNNKTGHPAVFPVVLAADHILSWSDPGDVVLDPFMGSGTTALACIKTGRQYIGFEISKEYCDTARSRVAEEIKKSEESEDNWMY